MMRECWGKSVNLDCTGLPTVAELTSDGDGPRLKMMVHTRSQAVTTTLGSAIDSRGDGGADDEIEWAKVEQGG
jgi:hypothetical protein